MKKLLTLLLCFVAFTTFGQTLIFNNDDSSNSLDIVYTTHIADTFTGLTQKAYPEYAKILKGLGKHLSNNEFYWENDCKIYNKFHFNTNGEVVIFRYNLLGFSLSEEKEQEFNRLLKSYFAGNKFDLEKPSAIPFSMGGCNSFLATKKRIRN
jgi:hypothetical protein